MLNPGSKSLKMVIFPILALFCSAARNAGNFSEKDPDSPVKIKFQNDFPIREDIETGKILNSTEDLLRNQTERLQSVSFGLPINIFAPIETLNLFHFK